MQALLQGRLGKAAEGRRSYARRQVPGYEPEGKTSRGRVRERATRGRRSKISEVQNQISVRFLLAEVRISLASGHLSERVGELPPRVAYMPRSWQPLKVLIVAEQALTSLVRCACLSLIRAKSLPGSNPQAPGHAVARDHALLLSRDGRFVARARRA